MREICICCVIIFVILALAFKGCKGDEPTAIDVYRGKTTLKITYKDSIPVDTIVVFK